MSTKEKATTAVETYVTINPTSFYHSACLRKGWCSDDAWLVVGFLTFNKWYNETRFARTRKEAEEVYLPYPACIGNTYEAAKKLCDSLNEGIVL